MAIVDNGIYVSGVRTDTPHTLDETFRLMHDRDGMGWIGLYRPSETEVRQVAAEFGLHELAVEDALTGHQRSKLERYGDTLFVVLRPARYLDATEEVEFGELHVFVGPNFVVTIRHAETPSLSRVRGRMERDPELLARGPEAVLYAILDELVDEYSPVLAGLDNDIDEIEAQLFLEEADVTQRIYELSREVIDFQRATRPLQPMLEALLRGSAKYAVDLELQRYLRDVLDHILAVAERVGSFRSALDNALTVEATIVARRQNEEMRRMTEESMRQGEEVKKISSWAAIFFAPTIVAGIYGMNFHDMPELGWGFGYPMAIGLMVGGAAVLYVVFKKRGWL
ncbi:magnesium and cobalt transport protein CorA [Microbacterium capsulatum]|uniref:Magnesium and cobalt transport protein CorA n=1 Tax=Microbacterium capsulatum TaxID=3041921 RepID=A0ABU0XLB6_9MICO|nr:magnesium and cobalt transport protein CorA [Microbacterium sp. ASV81]MDQ4214920.1 magnesium and cobalt transport protein CorA [Microbacterium sp. ASV81]